MVHYTKEELRNIFQRPFNQEAWKAILQNLFRADMIRKKAELFSDPEDNEKGYYMGAMETSDSYRIGLFYYIIENGSVAHKKVGLRNLVKNFINVNWGEFDAAIVVFDDKKEWRLSFVCNIKEEATAPKRFTFVFGEHDNFYRTAIDRFIGLQKVEPTFENIREAFSVDALSDDFFDEYREQYADFVQYITGKRYVKEGNKWVERTLGKPNSQYVTTFESNDKLVRDYIKKMFGRIVFLYFLQRKGWLNNNRKYMHDLFNNSDKKDNFLDGVLEPLFFEILNTDKPYRTSEARALPGSENIPYLNGGLFARDEIDERTCVFPAEYYKKLFDFLDSYNFTIDENDTDDAEIGIDPEMLGRIFENLLEDNKDKGAFYTPKEIVNYMCRESIIAYLQSEKFSEAGNGTIRKFVETYDGTSLSVEQRKYLKDKLKAVKICDPAIGSGAFPMGLVNLLSKLYSALRLSTDAAVIKRHIMEQNIYGVDIEKGAVDIARLRFWLAMIVEEKVEAGKDPIPLPNLHFKIMQGNSLLESYQGVDLSDMTKVKPVSRGLFDSDDLERESLVAALKKYYKTSDHQERDHIFNDIIKNVRRQLFAKSITLPQGMDPSANEEFFLWHTWFTDVFANGGFDIVIGNPPYISAIEAKKILSGSIRNSYKQNFASACGAYDMYVLFFELGINVLKENGVLGFITPSKYLSAEYSQALRELMLSKTNIRQFVDFSDVRVFKNAGVSTMITLLSKHKQGETITCSKYDTLTCPKSIHIHNKKYLTWLPDNIWGALLTDSLDILSKVLENSFPLSNIASINACSTAGEAEIYENALTESYQNAYKYINNGTFTRYTSFWGKKKLRKNNMESPYLPFSKSIMTERRKSMFAKPKILFAKIGKVPQAFLDSNGEYASANTNMVYDVKGYDLYALVAYFNSTLFNFIYRTMFGGLAMLGSIQIQAPQIRKFYVPNKHIVPSELIKLSQIICKVKAEDPYYDSLKYENMIDALIYRMFRLTYDDILIVDPSTPITRKEYNNLLNDIQ